jgi:hypothetical protein
VQPHELDLTSLIAGVLFTGLGGAFLADGLEVWNLRLEWVWPVLLVGLGLALIVPRRGGDEGDRSL